MRHSVRRNLVSLIKKLTGDTGIRFEPDGRVEFLIREVGDGSRIIYLANWEDKAARPVLGIDLPAGRYKVTLCGGDSFVLKEGLLQGQAEPDASLFRRFTVVVAPREVLLVNISPLPQKN